MSHNDDNKDPYGWSAEKNPYDEDRCTGYRRVNYGCPCHSPDYPRVLLPCESCKADKPAKVNAKKDTNG